MAATRCFTVFINLPQELRRLLELQLASLDKKTGAVWSRCLSIGDQGCADEAGASSYLIFDGKSSSRREASAQFAEQYIKEEALRKSFVSLITRQSLDEAGRGIFSGKRLNLFIVCPLTDLVATAIVNEVAAQLRAARTDHLASTISDMSVVGVFLMREPQLISEERRRLLYAFLKELHTLVKGIDGQRPLFDSVLFLSSQNANTQNPQGYQSLDEERFSELVVEVLATLQATPALVQETAHRSPDYSPYGSVGASTLFFNHEEVIERYAKDTASQLLARMTEAPAPPASERMADEFWPDAQLEKSEMGRDLIARGRSGETALHLLRFDPALWEFREKGRLAKLKIDYIDFLCAVPSRLAEYATYILTVRLRDMFAVVEANGARIQESFARKLEARVDYLLKTKSPAEAVGFLDEIQDRISRQRDDLKREGVDERNPLKIEVKEEKISFERKVEGGLPDLDYYYNDLEDSIAGRPLPLALFTRYIYLGLIVGYLADLVAVRIPDFFLNLGPLKRGGAPLLIVLSLFVLFAFLKHWRSNRHYRLARKFYIAAAQSIADYRAGRFLREEMEKVYMAARRLAEAEKLKVEKLELRLNEMKEAVSEPGDREPLSYFHVPLLGGRLPAGLRALERAPVFSYEFDGRTTPDFEKEMRDFIQAEDASGQKSFDRWRQISESEGEASREFLTRLLDFSGRGYAHIRQKRLSALLRTSSSADHNRALFDELHRLGFSPMSVEPVGAKAGLFLSNRWIASDPLEYEGGKVFPQITDGSRAIASDYTGHFRTATLMSFSLSSVPFFVECKRAYEILSEEHKETLRLETVSREKLRDPIDDLPEAGFQMPADEAVKPVV